MNVETAQKEMTDRMGSLLNDSITQGQVLAPRSTFEVFYRLNCDNLCADFTEHLEFRFSWGITSIIQRFAGSKASKLSLANYKDNLPALMSPSEPSTSIMTSGQPQMGAEWCILSRIAMASVGSQGTMGGLLLAGLMLKTIGWRLLAATGALYGCVYLYERLTWTNKAKERTFKKQYVQHATKKLRLIVDLTSANCSHQVQQELSTTFARLCHLVDEATTTMNTELCTLEQQLCKLETQGAEAKVLRNKANYVTNELEMFDDAYLKLH